MEQFRKGTVIRNMKKFKLVLCLAACLLGLSGCSILAETKPVDEATAQQLETAAQTIIDGAFAPLDAQSSAELSSRGAEYMEYVFENAMQMKVDGQAMILAFDSWNKAIDEIGAYQETTGYTAAYNTKGDSIIITAFIKCENKDAQVEIIFKDDLYHTVTSSATNITYTFGEKMEKAALNTLMGMGTVFAVLILLCLIISCFGFIPKIQASFSKDKKAKVEAKAPVDNTIAQIIEKEELSDDLELVAVITAAIAASGTAGSSASADDFVVRSIKRVSTNKWNKA